MRSRILRTVLTLAIILAVAVNFPLPDPVAAQTESFDPARAQRASVYIMQTYTNARGQAVISCVGSGTLVSTDGLILTNAHIALSSSTCRADKLVIGVTVRIGEAPVAQYYAEPVAQNIGWDLAVLQITSTIDGRPVDRARLLLPFVEIDAADLQELGATINVVGYPTPDEKSSGAAQVVQGTINGFTAEARIGDQSWIKTTAVISGGMSGGGAYNTRGKLVGIPTIEPTRSEGAAADCRRVQDANGDGRIDDQDTCIPVSGFINALRPARLARGLVLAARLGIQPEVRAPAQPESKPSGNPTFSRLFFAPGVTQAGMPTTVVTGLPTGVSRLYLFFDYDNMVDGMIYELRVMLDGVPNPTFSLSPATWSGGRQGMWYIGSTAQVWHNGTYEFRLLIEGVQVASKQITIGGEARALPTFSDILFGIISNNQLVSTGTVLPLGSTINAEFVYNNIPGNMPWRQRWYYEGLLVSESAGAWDLPDTNGKRSVSATGSATQVLQPGRYRVELYVGDGQQEQLAATSDFIMAGAKKDDHSEIFTTLSFATEVKDGKPAGATGTAFNTPPASLFATFDWRELAPGTPWTWRWSVNDNPLFEVTQPWTGEQNGSTFWVRLSGRGQMPDGSYELELLVGGVVVVSATAKVGVGQLPVTTFGSAEGVQVQGRIVDAETGQGVSGVSFIVLKTEFDSRDFVWDMSQVFTMSLTDSDGQYSLPRLLPRESTLVYTVIVVARGYLPVLTDTLAITDRTKSPLIINIELNRD
jgi:hypothetical protein